MGKITFSPKNILICIGGFFLGFFFSNTIIGFVKGLTQTGTPTTQMIGPLIANGVAGTLAGIGIFILTLLLLKKFMAFIIAIFIGIFVYVLLLGMGIMIPDIGSIFAGITL